jgi:prepilin-type N-terminal cleavage/methylation domain-containing protein
MAKLALLLELTRHQKKQKARREQYSPRDSAGYTLLELLVAILIVGSYSSDRVSRLVELYEPTPSG